jgi:ribosomal 30S subunit maturation factor RimM
VELHDVEGYSVVFADGRRLGRVAWIEYGSRSDQPDSLVVRRRIYQRPPLVRVAVEIVAAVDRREHAVTLDVAYDPRHFFLRQPL